MASTATLKAIVAAGVDLTLLQPRATETVRELCALAEKSGARITLSTGQTPKLIKELIDRYADRIAFVDASPKS